MSVIFRRLLMYARRVGTAEIMSVIFKRLLMYARRVGTAEIVETTPLEQRYMHQDWCTLFKSEMFMWLNQYLTRGTLPSSASRPGRAISYKIGEGSITWCT
eukprot:1158013-Pelagomonas_calceolata.AAC.6